MKDFKALRWFSCIPLTKGFRFLLAVAVVMLAMVFGAAFKAGAAQMGGAVQGAEIYVDPSPVVSTFAGTAGSGGSADGTGTAAKFNLPQGITTDGANLYVSDFNNHKIRKLSI